MGDEIGTALVVRPRRFPRSVINRVRSRWMTGRQTRGNLKRTNDQRSALASIDAWLRNLTYGHASISSASVDFRDATAAFVLALDDGDSMTMTFVSITDWSAVQQMSALQDDVLEAISDRWGEPEFNVGGYVA